MNFTKATSVARFILLLLVIATLLAFSICGVYINDDAQLHGIFDEGTIRLGLDLAGGSSIILRRALKALVENICTSSII